MDSCIVGITDSILDMFGFVKEVNDFVSWKYSW